MAKTPIVFSLVMVLIVSLQASFQDDKLSNTKRPSPTSVQYGSSTSLQKLADDQSRILVAHQAFMKTSPVQNVLFAICQGLDNKIVAHSIKFAMKTCPSPKLFAKIINHTVHYESPGVIALKRKINDGRYSGTQRAYFREQLAAIQATDFVKEIC